MPVSTFTSGGVSPGMRVSAVVTAGVNTNLKGRN